MRSSSLFTVSRITSWFTDLMVSTTGRTGITAEPVSITALATLSNTEVGVKQRAASWIRTTFALSLTSFKALAIEPCLDRPPGVNER